MIPDAVIRNIQSHVDLTLEFSPGITVLTGPTDAGKSAVVRALKWAADNRPVGETVLRHDTKRSEVIIKGVSKWRTASKHQYTFDGVHDKAIRTDVPPRIREQLRLSSVNFQEQHTPYFLISDKPGPVAKTLNKIADLEIIDDALLMMRQKVRQAKANKDDIEKRIKEKKEKIEEMSWVRELDADYKIVEALQAEAESIDVVELQKLIDEAVKIQDQLEGLPDPKENIHELETLQGRVKVDNTLENLIQEYNSIDKNIPDCSSDVSALVDFQEKLEYEDPLDELIKTFNSIDKNIPDCSPDVLTLENCIDALVVEDDGLDCQIVEILELREELEKFPLTIDTVQPTLDALNTAVSKEKEMEALINEYLIVEDQLAFANGELVDAQVNYNNFLERTKVCPLCNKGDLT